MKSAAARTRELLLATGANIEATVVLLPDRLTAKQREMAREALCEASAILADAATRVVAVLPKDE